jgi:excisionase family DNA binding protein
MSSGVKVHYRGCKTMLEQLAFNRKDAANALGISLRTLDYLLASGELRGRRVGRRVVIPRVTLEAFLKRDHPTNPDKVDQSDDR